MKISMAAARVNAKLSQEKAADEIGVSKSTIQKWENGTTVPSGKYIPIIEKVYGASYNDINFLPC